MSTSIRSLKGGYGYKESEEVCRTCNGQVTVGLDGGDKEKAIARFACLPDTYLLRSEYGNVMSMFDLRKSMRDFSKKNPEALPISTGNHRPGEQSYGSIFPTDPYDLARWWADRFVQTVRARGYLVPVFERMTVDTDGRTFVFSVRSASMKSEICITLDHICSWDLVAIKFNEPDGTSIWVSQGDKFRQVKK